MTPNIGTADRVLRYLLGTILILAPLWNEHVLSFAPWIVAASVVVGVISTITAFYRVCPLYRALGANTCRPPHERVR